MIVHIINLCNDLTFQDSLAHKNRLLVDDGTFHS